MQNLLLLEDHTDAQRWLAQALKMAFGPKIDITIAALLSEAQEKIQQTTFDLALIDLHLPDGSGIELIQQIKQNHAELPCVVTTIYDDDNHLFPALEAGADGYLLKDSGQDSIAQMLQGILAGQPPLSPAIAQKIMRHFQHKETPRNNSVHLSPREQEVLGYISTGLKIKQCAHRMDISYHIANEYIRGVYQKLQVHSQSEAVMAAIRTGLISP